MFYKSKRLAALLLAAATAAGCAMPPSRIEFVENLARENRKIARATQAFAVAIKPLSTGTAPDPAAVQKAYDNMQKAVKQVKADADDQMLPPSSNTAKDLLSAYKKYLEGEQAILDDPMQKILQEILAPPDDNGQPTLDQRRDYVFGTGAKNNQDGMIAQVMAQENAAWEPVKAAQDGYASEHNYQLISLRDYIASQKK